MEANEKNITAYLDRIGYNGSHEPNAENLALIQYAHLLSVPYENLDILMGIPLSLEIDALYDKVVRRGRGGYCFELNELFGWLLRGLGYNVTDYVSRYLRGESGIPKRRHQVLSVECPGGERFLCDVGVGAVIPMAPVPYIFDTEFSDPVGAVYSLRRDPVWGVVLTEAHGGQWRDVYGFTEEVQLDPDFIFASFWCEHSSDSPFNKDCMLSIRKPGKRITLDGLLLREFSREGVTERELTKAERLAAFEEIFGLRLEHPERFM